jgi:hypothetical protein
VQALLGACREQVREQTAKAGRHDDVATAAALGRGHLAAHERAGYVETPAFEIHVFPLEPWEFSSPQRGGEQQSEGRVESRFALTCEGE